MAVWPGCACWVCQRINPIEMIIRMEPLTREAFSPFGDVLATNGISPELINHGNTQKFTDLAKITLGSGGQAQISIYRSNAVELPFLIRQMERHPLGSQAFFPLHKQPFPIVVALPGNYPDLENIRAFLSDGQQGVNIHPGVWHHYQLTLGEQAEYLVIDRSGPESNCDVIKLDREVLLHS